MSDESSVSHSLYLSGFTYKDRETGSAQHSLPACSIRRLSHIRRRTCDARHAPSLCPTRNALQPQSARTVDRLPPMTDARRTAIVRAGGGLMSKRLVGVLGTVVWVAIAASSAAAATPTATSGSAPSARAAPAPAPKGCTPTPAPWWQRLLSS